MRKEIQKSSAFWKELPKLFEFHKMLFYIRITKLFDTEAKSQNEEEYLILYGWTSGGYQHAMWKWRTFLTLASFAEALLASSNLLLHFKHLNKTK